MELEPWRRLSLSMHEERFSARTFDARGALTPSRLASVRAALRAHGGLFVQHTGLTSVAALQSVMPALGFGEATRFLPGGRASGAWQEKWVADGLRRLDYYPPELYLLPNNEVQYRHQSPRWVLFACLRPAEVGGRVFLHDARAVEAALPGALVSKLERHGLCIETGFLDEAHPEKRANYFQSWQERFGTDVPDEALARARAQRDDCDEAWWRDDGTLMTRIVLPARWAPGGCLRFPRVALDAPAARNGFRRFLLGDGASLSEAENEQLRAAFLATREGAPLGAGDLVLFDNHRFGHSREAFAGARELLVGMAVEAPERPEPLASFAPAPPNRYALKLDSGEELGARTLEGLDFACIARELQRHGAVHVRRTGLTALDEATLARLGFGADEAFAWGGAQCGRTHRRALTKHLRATDDYPRHLWLLPHNEVLYQRELPARLLFFSAAACDGRTFVHAATHLRAWLEARAPALVDALRTHGILIEMGFIDERHPQRSENYFRSWQERFGTTSREEAEARCRAATSQFDECWWREDDGCFTLMTRIRVPAFHGETMLFPRIPLDPPSLRNGFRRYPKGNGEEFSDEETNLLLHAFLATREGVRWEAGDLLLLDNLRYGHSREPFEGPRALGVAMAGKVRVG